MSNWIDDDDYDQLTATDSKTTLKSSENMKSINDASKIFGYKFENDGKGTTYTLKNSSGGKTTVFSKIDTKLYRFTEGNDKKSYDIRSIKDSAIEKISNGTIWNLKYLNGVTLTINSGSNYTGGDGSGNNDKQRESRIVVDRKPKQENYEQTGNPKTFFSTQSDILNYNFGGNYHMTYTLLNTDTGKQVVFYKTDTDSYTLNNKKYNEKNIKNEVIKTVNGKSSWVYENLKNLKLIVKQNDSQDFQMSEEISLDDSGSENKSDEGSKSLKSRQQQQQQQVSGSDKKSSKPSEDTKNINTVSEIFKHKFENDGKGTTYTLKNSSGGKTTVFSKIDTKLYRFTEGNDKKSYDIRSIKDSAIEKISNGTIWNLKYLNGVTLTIRNGSNYTGDDGNGNEENESESEEDEYEDEEQKQQQQQQQRQPRQQQSQQQQPQLKTPQKKSDFKNQSDDTKKIDDLNLKIKELQNELNESNAKYKQLTKKSSREDEKYQKTLKELASALQIIDKLKNQKSSGGVVDSEEINKLKNELKESTRIKNNLTSDIAKYNNENDNFKKKLKEIEDENIKLKNQSQSKGGNKRYKVKDEFNVALVWKLLNDDTSNYDEQNKKILDTFVIVVDSLFDYDEDITDYINSDLKNLNGYKKKSIKKNDSNESYLDYDKQFMKQFDYIMNLFNHIIDGSIDDMNIVQNEQSIGYTDIFFIEQLFKIHGIVKDLSKEAKIGILKPLVFYVIYYNNDWFNRKHMEKILKGLLDRYLHYMLEYKITDNFGNFKKYIIGIDKEIYVKIEKHLKSIFSVTEDAKTTVSSFKSTPNPLSFNFGGDNDDYYNTETKKDDKKSTASEFFSGFGDKEEEESFKQPTSSENDIFNEEEEEEKEEEEEEKEIQTTVNDSPIPSEEEEEEKNVVDETKLKAKLDEFDSFFIGKFKKTEDESLKFDTLSTITNNIKKMSIIDYDTLNRIYASVETSKNNLLIARKFLLLYAYLESYDYDLPSVGLSVIDINGLKDIEKFSDETDTFNDSIRNFYGDASETFRNVLYPIYKNIVDLETVKDTTLSKSHRHENEHHHEIDTDLSNKITSIKKRYKDRKTK
jgi:hypothetical protein